MRHILSCFGALLRWGQISEGELTCWWISIFILFYTGVLLQWEWERSTTDCLEPNRKRTVRLKFNMLLGKKHICTSCQIISNFFVPRRSSSHERYACPSPHVLPVYGILAVKSSYAGLASLKTELFIRWSSWVWAGRPASAGSLFELVNQLPAVSKYSFSCSNHVKLGAGLNW